MWYKAGPGRTPRLADPEIRELRIRHLVRGVPIETLMEQTGMGKSMLHKIMNGQRRKKAGGPTRQPDAGKSTRHMTSTVVAIRGELIRNPRRKQLAIARQYGVSPSYVSKIKKDLRREKKSMAS